MFSIKTMGILIAWGLLAHCLAHAFAFGALIAQSLRGLSDSRVVILSWLFPAISPKTAAAAAIPFWALSTIGFLAASMSFWDLIVPGGAWRLLAAASAIISILSIALFSGIWPGSRNQARSILNTSITLAMNVAILVSLLWMGWPPHEMFGK